MKYRALILTGLLAMALPTPVLGGWKQLTPENHYLVTTNEAGVALLGKQVLVSDAYAASPGATSFTNAEALTFEPTVDDPTVGLQIATTPAPWYQIDQDVPIVSTAAGTNLLLGGNPTATGTPYSSWLMAIPDTTHLTGPTQIGAIDQPKIDSPIAVTAGGAPLFMGNDGHAFRLGGASVSDQNSIPTDWSCCSKHATPGADVTGALWVAWYSTDPNHSGLYLRALNPQTGAPAGDPIAVPLTQAAGAVARFGDQHIPLACNQTGPGCRLVYEVADPAQPADAAVYSWWPGEAAPTKIAPISQARGIDAAYDEAGHLWIAWYERGVKPDRSDAGYRETRGDGKGAGGTIVNLAQPTDAAGSTADGSLRIQPIGDKLLLLPTWSDLKGIGIWAGFFGPASRSKGGGRDSAGRKTLTLHHTPNTRAGLIVNVDFTVPEPCAAPCLGRGEIWDGGKLIARRIKLPFQRVPGKTIKFRILIKAARLAKVVFKSKRGNHVAAMQLRVSIREGGTERLFSRDITFLIKGSDVKHGKLPGLGNYVHFGRKQ